MRKLLGKVKTQAIVGNVIRVMRFALPVGAVVALKLVSPAVETAAATLPESTGMKIISSEVSGTENPTPDWDRLLFDAPVAVTEHKEEQPPDEAVSITATAKGTAVRPDRLFTLTDTNNSDAEENDAVATTITGEKSSVYLSAEGIYFKNKTEYEIDVSEYLNDVPDVCTKKGRVLIIHTHGTESYARTKSDPYEETDHSRTTDDTHNVVRVGDELEKVLTSRGIEVIHDREYYDYPGYTGAYTRSYDAICDYMEKYPDIIAVIDLHRDALESEDGTVYKTVADVSGETCAQVLIIAGSNWSGLDHPKWKDNLTFAFHLQKTMADKYPTLARPLKISQYRYNQQATTGSLIIEIGCNGNTLDEAIKASQYFGDCFADVLGK